MSRAAVLDQVAALVPDPIGADCVRVGIDGADGAGKTVFADSLASVLRARGRPVARISVDSFHHSRSVRYRRGRDSAEGFWLDAFDYERLWRYVLTPLGPNGSRWYRDASHDLRADRDLDLPAMQAPDGAVVIVDGLFLLRPELDDAWEFCVRLDVPFSITAQRLAARDGRVADPDGSGLRRYLDAQQIYVAQCRPSERANVVVDNSDFDAPVITRAGR